MSGSAPLTVIRTYLEMLDRPRPAPLPPEGFAVRPLPRCTPAEYRSLYAEVGRAHRWTDRLAWSDEVVSAHLARTSTHLYLLEEGREPAGWYEVVRHDDASAEIAYFGLMPGHIGRGLGRWMLSAAVEHAWDTARDRIWLHTCTLDHAAALPNYLARGFRIFRQETYEIAGE